MADKVCGVDLHKDFFVACLLAETREVKRFKNSLDGIEALKKWLGAEGCRRVVMESTGVYWVPLYMALEGDFEPVLANPYQVKAIPGRKMDESDAEWLAKLLRANLIKPSYVPEPRLRELRELERLRVKFVRMRTDCKNRARKVLERCNVRLHEALTDAFGRRGRRILKGLMEGQSLDEIVKGDRLLDARRDRLEEALRGTLTGGDVFILNELLEVIDGLEEKVERVEAKMAKLLKDDGGKVEALMSVPGVGFIAATTILGEVGDVSRFPSPKHLVSYAGLAPSLYQSGCKTLTGGTGRRCCRQLKWIMVQVAHAALRVKDSRLRGFFLRVKARRGFKVAIVALARKILCIVWHLLVNGEAWDEGVKAPRPPKVLKVPETSLSSALNVVRRAGYMVISPLSHAKSFSW